MNDDKKYDEGALDKALADSFPASDPVAPAAPTTKPLIVPETLKKDAHEARKTGEKKADRKRRRSNPQ